MFDYFNVFHHILSLSPRHPAFQFLSTLSTLSYYILSESVNVFQLFYLRISTISTSFIIEFFNVFCFISNISSICISTSFIVFHSISVQNISVSFKSFNIFHNLFFNIFQRCQHLSNKNLSLSFNIFHLFQHILTGKIC